MSASAPPRTVKYDEDETRRCHRGRRQQRERTNRLPRPAARRVQMCDRHRRRQTPRPDLGLDEGRRSEQQARRQDSGVRGRALAVTKLHHCPRRRKDHQHLGVGGEHVVTDEGRPVDDQRDRGDHAGAAMPVARRDGQRGQRNDDRRGDEMHPGQPGAASELGEREGRVEQRRLVVDEVGVEQSALQQDPGADDMTGFVDVDDVEDEREPSGRQADRDEQPEQPERAPPLRTRSTHRIPSSGLLNAQGGAAMIARRT